MDALLARPGAYIRDPVLWQWQDDKGNWHTYGYNDCRVIEAAHVAGEEEVTLTGIFSRPYNYIQVFAESAISCIILNNITLRFLITQPLKISVW